MLFSSPSPSLKGLQTSGYSDVRAYPVKLHNITYYLIWLQPGERYRHDQRKSHFT